MTEIEAKNMLNAKLKCMQLYDLSCIEKGCNRDCDSCDFNYAKGNSGEQKEALQLAINAIKKNDKIKLIVEDREGGLADEIRKILGE